MDVREPNVEERFKLHDKDKTIVDASPCLEGVCSGVVYFGDVPPVCPLSSE